MAKGQGLLLAAALLLAIVVGVVLWATTASDAPAPLPAEAPEPAQVPVAGQVGLDPAESDAPHARALQAPPQGPPDDASAAKPSTAARDAASISGVVRRRGGGLVAEGTTVLARTSQSPQSDAELLERIRRGDPDLPVARTARDGSFRIEHVVPGSNYLLSAVGDGCVSVEPAVAAFTGSTDVAVDVCVVYGVAVELREEGGRPLRSSIEVLDLAQSRTPNSTPLQDSPLLALLGADLAAYRAPPNRRLLLFTSSKLEEPAVLEAIPIRVKIAGYSQAQAAFDAQPVLPSLPVHTIEMRPSAAGFGEILLRFTDGDDPTIDAPRTKSWRLVLASTTGIQADVELPRDPGVKRLGGIPYGLYRLSVVNALDQEIYPVRSEPGQPSKPLEVGERPLAIDVSLAETSTLEIAVAAADPGVAYRGPATFSLARGDPTPDRRSIVGPTGTVSFDRAPYLLGGLRPGHYMLFVQQPAGAAPDPTSGAGYIDLASGQRTTVRLFLP